MTSACCLWSDSAWEAPCVSASLMAAEQMLSASLMAAEQMALAPDSMGADGFSFFNGLLCLRVILMKIIPSSWTAFCLWASMDDLVAK